MKCHYCETENTENRLFCSCCGTRLEKAAVAEVEEKAQPLTVEEIAVADAVKTAALRETGWEAAEEILPPAVQRPEIRLPEERGLGKMVFLGILTLGIYPTVIWSRLVTELNLAGSRYDGRRTMPYFAMLLLVPLTLGIYGFVWMNGLCRRIGGELSRRELEYRFGPRDFWLWNVLGLLILIGPFVFLHKLMKAMNLINADYNLYG